MNLVLLSLCVHACTDASQCELNLFKARGFQTSENKLEGQASIGEKKKRKEKRARKRNVKQEE